MAPPNDDSAPQEAGGGSTWAPDDAFIRDVLDHATTQLQKGWTPLEVVSNVRARYSLLEQSAKYVVGVLVASRSGRFRTNAERAEAEVTEDLGMSPEVAAVIVAALRAGTLDPDEPQTVRLDFDPERELRYVVPTPPDARPASSPTAGPGEAAAASDAAAPKRRSRVVGPIRIEMNLLPKE